MRHNKKFNHLSRTSAHRKAMLANMASSLIGSKRINTTVAKAKALRMYVEPLITRAKNDTTHSRRVVFRHLQDKNAVSELFREVAVKIGDRPGGYTRILRTGNRLGDNAEMCIIELVDYNENMLAAKEETAKPKRKRSRRGGSGSGKKAEGAKPAADTTPAGDEAEVAEEVKTEESSETAQPEAEVKEKPKAEAPEAQDSEPTEEENKSSDEASEEGEDKKEA